MIFSVIQDVLILQPSDPEFYLTILLGLAAIAAFPVIYLIVSNAPMLYIDHDLVYNILVTQS